MSKKYNFGGYATRNDLTCADGRVIRSGAFAANDGVTVPLVWQHRHDSPENVLGHALLENRSDGVYAYCSTNDTPAGEVARKIVEHGDVCALSIFANQLKQRGSEVIHGNIREVSLVLAGANPGALIDNLQFAHGEDYEIIDDEADIYCNSPIEHSDEDFGSVSGTVDSKPNIEDVLVHEDSDDVEDVDDAESVVVDDPDAGVVEDKEDEAIEHADKMSPQEAFESIPEEKRDAVYSIIGAAAGEGEPTDDAEEVFNSLTDAQRDAVYQIIGSLDEEDEEDDQAEHSALEGESMKKNVFDETAANDEPTLTHDEISAIFAEAQAGRSLRDVVVAHGITDIEVLFPEVQTVSATPELISRDMEWVADVLASTHKTPFARIKSTAANITADEARARGYIKGKKKVEEQLSALKRTTDPQTIYKLQKLDRDDIVDITDFNVVAWIKQEMRVMLNEEIARAILVGDGRSPMSDDKIKPDHIRPIWGDSSVYVTYATLDPSLTGTAKAKAFIEAAIRNRKYYKGSGNPVLYVGIDLLTEMRLIRDDLGYRLYKNDQELADELRVSKIVPIEQFDGLTRTVDGNQNELGGIIVNLIDYNVGANKGGEVTLFDNFDLNYNKEEYLIETRISGALIRPKAAIAIEFGVSSEETTEETTEETEEMTV